MKRIISALCAVLTAVTVFMTGCANNGTGESGSHKLYLKMDYVSDEVKAVFVNKATGNTQETVMKRGEDGDGFYQYSCTGDTEAYNKVYFTYDGEETDEVAFNDLVDGWYISSYGVLPCTEGVEYSRDIPLTRLTFPFNGEDKDVYVWTPGDYDPESEDKYSVIYLLDGDSILADEAGIGTWNAPESVVSAMKHSDFKAIVVGIATRENTRYRELAPDLGAPREEVADEYDHREGNEFCDFVVNTVVPGIEKQYNVYTDPVHNAISGSSLGGLESFYIGMEHPEKFGNIGAMSPSFWMYDDNVWEDYLKQKDFSQNAPFVYMYAGDDWKDNGICAKPMMELLEKLDYPADRKVLDLYDKGDHRIYYWRYIFPEFLEAMYSQKVAVLM